MIYALFLLASLGFASSTETVSAIDSIHLSNINKDIRELQSGRPVITGVPDYRNGLSVGSAGISWADGTTSTTGATTFQFTSSFTVVPGADVTAAVFALSYATVTIVSDGTHYTQFGVWGDMQFVSGASQEFCWDYWIDGAYRTAHGLAHGSTGGRCLSETSSLSHHFSDTDFAKLSAGSHTIAIMFREYSGNTARFPSAGADGTHSPVIFGAWTAR